jgi:hypothetical protein
MMSGNPPALGRGGSTIGAWELTTVEMLETAITETGGDPAQAEGEFALHNRNGDAISKLSPHDRGATD